MADEVNDMLHFLSDEGYLEVVKKFRVFLEAQGKYFAQTRKINREIHSEMSLRLVAAEKLLKAHGLDLPS